MPISPEEAQKLLADKYWRMNHLYKIKTKDAKLKTLVFNDAQDDYWRSQSNWDIILKARQLGFSTECLIDDLDETISRKNINTAIIAHQQEKVMLLFEIVRLAYENMPTQLKPRVSYDNRNELYFPELNSKIYVSLDTRGETVHVLHISEVAFIKEAEKRMPGILGSVPKNGKVRFESTANGMSGVFYETWMDANTKFRKHFYNWLWDKEYSEPTLKSEDQLLNEYYPLARQYGLIEDIYTRFKLSLEQFQWYISMARLHKHLLPQEFPTNPLEAFISLGRNVFDIRDIQKHEPALPIDRKWRDLKIWEHPMPGFRYVIGCDPSEGVGGDNAVIEVFNAYTGVQAAEYSSNYCPPDMLAGLLLEIGNYFNKGFIVLEINNHGFSVRDKIKTKYENLFRREVYDKISRQTTQSIGWRTTGVTKPMIVDTLEEAVRTQSVRIYSENLLSELKTFVRTDERGKQGYGAEGSNKDDRVIAAGLALQGIRHLPQMKAPETIAQRKLKEFIEKQSLPKTLPPIHPRQREKSRIRGVGENRIVV